MIVDTQGTIFITADAFRDRYLLAPKGCLFSYATGDLNRVSHANPEAWDLVELVFKMEEAGRISLVQRPRDDLNARCGAAAFEYFARKLKS